MSFQSTPFARRETFDGHLLGNFFIKFQSTPFARRETKWLGLQNIPGTVSIHSLRKKGDIVSIPDKIITGLFQSTPFARRETLLHVLQ